MVGDFGGGGMFLAYGVVCALLEAQRSGAGQVVDAAMVDGSAVLMTMFWAFSQLGLFDEGARGTNLLDTGAHFYDVYRCADGEYVSIGSIEPQFYAELLRLTGLDGDEEFAAQMDRDRWPALKERLAELFATKTRDEWCALMEHTDVCFAPVLTMSEAAKHPHNVERATFVELDGMMQPAPAPRFSRTVPEVARPPAHPGQHTREALADWGSPPSASTPCSRPAPWRCRPDRWRRSSSSTPIPTTRPSRTGGSMARAAAEGHRVVLVVCTNGELGEVPDDLAEGETLVDRRRAETERSAAVPRRAPRSPGSATATPG